MVGERLESRDLSGLLEPETWEGMKQVGRRYFDEDESAWDVPADWSIVIQNEGVAIPVLVEAGYSAALLIQDVR